MSSKKHALAVVIGRFEPLHSGHLVLLRKALHIAQNVLVLVGSSYCARNIKNPFSYNDRSVMISESLSEKEQNRLITMPLVDNLYSDDAWLKEVQDSIKQALTLFQTWTDRGGDNSVVIVGNKKDESSYYLDMFPQYAFESIEEIKMGLDATAIRKIMFEEPEKLEILQSLVSDYTFRFLKDFTKTEEYARLEREYNVVKKYKASWSVAPYAPTFVTVDAVVKKTGHVLMVRRKFAPGEGLLALPGGFVNQNESLRDACLRELFEETKIDLPPRLLQSCILNAPSKVFDHPDRSLRGRTISHAFLLDLDVYDKGITPPAVFGSDDAQTASWIPFDDLIYEHRAEIYEDHLSIIRSMVGV